MLSEVDGNFTTYDVKITATKPDLSDGLPEGTLVAKLDTFFVA